MTRAASTLLLLIATCALSQTHPATRPRKEPIRVPLEDQPTELFRAEEAIQKNDFTAAESLLKKAIHRDPKNYQAWFDLGFVYNRLRRTEESIHAYRQSVAAKPDVFESNLNLGLMLARSNSPEAEQFLRHRPPLIGPARRSRRRPPPPILPSRGIGVGSPG